MHRLLKRQIKKHLGRSSDEGLPPELVEFVHAVGAAYEQSDADRCLLERSLELSSRELLRSNEEMRAVLAAFPDMLFSLDQDGSIKEVRAGAAASPYVRAESLIGRKIQDIPREPASRLFREALTRLQGEEHQVTIEYDLGADGIERHYEARLIRQRGHRVFAIIRDATERFELESRMRQSEKLSAVGQLAAGVAHEINNPLAVILGFASSLARRVEAGAPEHMAVKSIEREALRCRDLVRALLEFARKDSGAVVEFDAGDAVSAALSLVAPQARLKGVSIVSEVQGRARLRGDRTQIQQMLINLCTNAVDALQSGGKLRVRVERLSAGHAPLVRLVVADDGPGIPRAIQPKIFEPFFTTKEPGRGTGLGLALVHECVRKHHGSITVRSEEGAGAEFTIEFPAQAALGPDDARP